MLSHDPNYYNDRPVTTHMLGERIFAVAYHEREVCAYITICYCSNISTFVHQMNN
jgi:hypothetical protein